ncbi:phage baseplate assembly protein V [Streptomyces sp. NPDC048161]|uniref:phage baseplate assembly protein V n=1 Tax=Streptomyces sp. NPDC048161 TaxID=3160985 RepID=UPI0033FD37E8
MSASSTPHNHGVVEALVVESEPDGGARVRLRFPWHDSSEAGVWSQVVATRTVHGRGTVPLPAPGDRVLAVFVQGDMGRPVVLGSLHSDGTRPREEEADGNSPHTIRSGHGHEVVVDDSSSSAAVRITSAAGHVVDLDEDGSTIRITPAPGGAVTVAGKGDYEVTAAKSITLKAPEVTVDSPSIKLGGDAAVEPLVLGTALLEAFSTHTHTCSTGPTSPPPVPLPPAVLAQNVRAI